MMRCIFDFEGDSFGVTFSLARITPPVITLSSKLRVALKLVNVILLIVNGWVKTESGFPFLSITLVEAMNW